MPPSQPTIISLPYPADSLEYASHFAAWAGFIWLDSGTRREYCGQYDLITALPSQSLCAHSPTHIELTQQGTTQSISVADAKRWCEAQIQAAAPESNEQIPFNGGLLGYIGYEWNHQAFKLPVVNRLATPLMYLGVYEWALIIDHTQQTAYFIFTDNLSAEYQRDILQQLNTSADARGGFYCGAFVPQTEKEQYFKDINTILNFIQAGDCYQVNYAQAFSAQFTGDAFVAYCQLRSGCPGPFSAYISTNQGAILSLSPEQFIQIDAGKQATSRPIKGTAARSSQQQLDAEAAHALEQSEKNKAENLMIVDLLRNDLSKNCRPGSVKVSELFGLYSFTNVHHLISTIQGTLRADVNPWQFIIDAFPGGSITGAPKKRAMEIIHQLEPYPRHIYCGCIGYWSRNGQARTNIAIRTLLIEGTKITLWGGGGVVADSNAEAEYQESLDKIAIFKTILTRGNA